MSTYTSISIIFNPNSTGNGQQLGAELRDTLKNERLKTSVELIATEHIRHAETLAYKLAKDTKNPLIISASGDGGYNEVINGIMKANQEGAQAVVGLLPAGNANDHYHSLHSTDISNLIIKQKERRIDLLTITATKNNEPFRRYAHSYIGIGLTPKVGRELNKTNLNWWNEILIVLKVLFFLKPTRINIEGKNRSYDSIIFSNIDRMAKVLTLSKDTSVNDGKFEITTFKQRNKLKLIRSLIRTSTIGLEGSQQLSEYNFKTARSMLIQLDGEVFKIDANSEVKIGIERTALACIV